MQTIEYVPTHVQCILSIVYSHTVGILTPLISNNQHTIDWQENIYQHNLSMSISANIFHKATMYQFYCIPALEQFIITVILTFFEIKILKLKLKYYYVFFSYDPSDYVIEYNQ